MEKSTEKRKFTRFIRLLILFIFFSSFNSMNLFAHIYSNVVFTSVEQYVFANADTAFEAVIPNIKPTDVLITVQTLPEGVSFVSSDTTEILTELGRSTKVRIILHFDNVGDYKLPPVASRIKWGSYRLKFAPVTVLYNPQTIQPILQYQIINPADGKYYQGQKIELLLTATFAYKIKNFSYTLNENSMFIQKSLTEELPYVVDEFTDVPYPIVLMDFIPLEVGKISIPEMTVKVQTWNDIEKDLLTEPCVINVIKSPVGLKKNEIIQSEITLADQNEDNAPVFILSDEQRKCVNQIADLRSQEKIAFHSKKYTQQRQLLEQELNLGETPREWKEVTKLITLCVIIFIVLVGLIFIIAKRKPFAIITGILLFFAVIFLIICNIECNKKHAVLLNGTLMAIPEEKSSSVLTLPIGTRVQIIDFTGSWAFVACDDKTNGWIKKTDLVEIRKVKNID